MSKTSRRKEYLCIFIFYACFSILLLYYSLVYVEHPYDDMRSIFDVSVTELRIKSAK